jgi:murein DD-endopeptidase MepM/ murein hydrolase activator NlpD
MARRFYTIYVVPHARARFREIRIRPVTLGISATVLAILVAATVLVLPGMTIASWNRGMTVERLQNENEELRAASAGYEDDLADLRGQLSGFEAMAMKFAVLAGVEDLPTDRMPSGSAGEEEHPSDELGPGYLNEELSILSGRASALNESFQMLERAYADQQVRLASTPSIMPTPGILGSGFRYRKDPFNGKRAFHGGLDIVANVGSPVVATADGVVTHASRLGGYGKVVYISHGNGLSTRYAHLSKILVKKGQEVHRGDLLGKVGATGRAMGYHLHYEVLRDGNKVNPLEYILDDDLLN